MCVTTSGNHVLCNRRVLHTTGESMQMLRDELAKCYKSDVHIACTSSQWSVKAKSLTYKKNSKQCVFWCAATHE